jgi:hypothetical protein
VTAFAQSHREVSAAGPEIQDTATAYHCIANLPNKEGIVVARLGHNLEIFGTANDVGLKRHGRAQGNSRKQASP